MEEVDHGGGDVCLLGRSQGGSRFKGGFRGSRPDRDRTAHDASQHAFELQRLDVTTNRHFRHAELSGETGEVDLALVEYALFDQRSSPLN